MAMTLVGQQLGHYQLIRLIKQGGMGEVYLAEDTRIPRQIAVKVICNERQLYADAQALAQAEWLFQREMKAISQLDHPSILGFYDFGEEPVANGSIIYMVMPYRSEGSLADWLVQHGSHLLPPQDIGHLIAQAASALQHAHDRNIIHQDVKPSNFLVRANADHPTRPDLLLVDFGIARIMSATSTTGNNIRGTISYMAPEQWKGDTIPASDQYALAIMSYLLLAGQLPFRGQPEQIMFQHLTVPPKPPSELNASLSPAIDAVILRALAKKSSERFITIKVFAVALQQALTYVDHRATLAISRAEALQGGNRAVMLSDKRKVTVTIPPAAQHGQVLHLPGQGLPYYDGGPRGPLLLTLSTNQDKTKSLVVDTSEDDLPTMPTSDKLVKRSPSITNSQKPRDYSNVPASITPIVITPVSSPSEAVQPSDNVAPLAQALEAALPARLDINRNLLSTKQGRSIVITLALVLLTLGSLLTIASVNNTSVANTASSTATTQRIANSKATATTQSRLYAHATATSQVTVNSSATAIASNPDPYQPPSGTLALVDPLSQPNVWGNASDTNTRGQCRFVNSTYQISQPQPNKLYQCPESNQYSNFAFEVKMTISQGDCGGMTIRNQSNNADLYLFQVCQDGTYDFYKYAYNSASGPTTVLSGSPAAINQGVGKSNIIAVGANGSNFDLYINGQKVGSASDSTYSQGSIGLVASAYNSATIVTYQNARVWTMR
jgi:serine/threonine protein kinase